MSRRIALVTGASSGIGEEFVRQLVELSQEFSFNEIWLLARRKDRLEVLAAELGARNPGIAVVILAVDLQAPGALSSLFTSLGQGDRVSLLVNNAGLGSYGPFADHKPETETKLVDLNCRVLTELCSRSLAHMEAGSRIINVASLAAFSPLGNFAVYAATKAYVLNFSVALAAELEPRGISVLALCPGSVSSEFAFVASNGARREVSGGHSATPIVRSALKHSLRRRWISLPLASWSVTAFLSRFLGRRFLARLSNRNMKRPYNAE